MDPSIWSNDKVFMFNKVFWHLLPGQLVQWTHFITCCLTLLPVSRGNLSDIHHLSPDTEWRGLSSAQFDFHCSNWKQ